MQHTLSFAAPAIPALMLTAGVIARFLNAKTAGSLVINCSRLCIFLSIAATFSLDSLGAAMTLLIAFLGMVVLRFSKNYLAGDPAQSRFFSWMSITLAAVLTLVQTENLLLIFTAWVATSLSLHRLLLHYPERAGAIFSARKKFVVSRTGDLSLLLALIVIWKNYGSWNLPELFTAAAAGNTQCLPLVGFLIIFCAALKSAQFPFHSWLPDTMETPTPVSALMHAGIINAGGFLVIRLSPLMIHAPMALHTLAVVGTITAAFGAIVMLTQPGVKRSLAYSTIAQMGFMLLQCGLGAFGLCLLHIVAHSLYKAYAFLHAGSTVGAVARKAIPLSAGALVAGTIASLLLTSLLILGLHAHFHVFSLILALAVAYGLARFWSLSVSFGSRLIAVFMATGIILLSLLLHAGSNHLLADATISNPSGLLVFIGIVFGGLFIFQIILWRAAAKPFGRRFYLHAMHGFYVGTIANRLLGNLWPKN